MGSHEAVRREYDLLAQAYETRWKWYLEATLRETAARMEVRPGDRILDVGAGTGRLLAHLAGAHPASLLAGVDLSRGMLQVARSRVASSVLLSRARAETLPFPDGTFHRVVSASSLHFWPEPRTGLQEMARVLRPGGELILTDWCRDFWGQVVRDAYLGLVDAAHVRVYRGRELEGMLQEAGLQVLSVDRYRIRPTWGMMTARARWPVPEP